MHLWYTNISQNIDYLVSYKWLISGFYSNIIFFNKKAKKDNIKFKRTSVRLNILNHTLNSLNITIIKEVIIDPTKDLLVDHQFLYDDIYLNTSRKDMEMLCDTFVTSYGLANTYFDNCLAINLIQWQLSVIIICFPPGVLNALDKNIEVELAVVVEYNMVYMLSNI